MFDDPKKELKELEGQLLAAETDQETEQETADLDTEAFEEIYDEILGEYGSREQTDGTTATAEPPIRNFANGYGRNVQSVPLGTDGDEILPDDQPQPKQKGVKGLVFTACLECIAIAVLLVFWYFSFL